MAVSLLSVSSERYEIVLLAVFGPRELIMQDECTIKNRSHNFDINQDAAGRTWDFHATA